MRYERSVEDILGNTAEKLGLGGQPGRGVCGPSTSGRAVSYSLDGQYGPVKEVPADGQDTEFPGIVARPIGQFKTGSDYHFQTMRCNVDMLKVIQLGLTLSDEDGNSPEPPTWQFNFAYNLG